MSTLISAARSFLLCFFIAGGTAPATSLTQPDEYPVRRQVHQQVGGIGDIPIRGFYDAQANPSPVIEARYDNGAWIVIDPAPSGGVFAGVLTGQPIGFATLKLRIQGGVDSLYQIKDVGVGDVYVIAGQSNAVMTTQTVRTSSEATTTLMLVPDPANLYKETADPLHEPTHPWGSVWPPLADSIVGDTDIPIMFVATAEANTGLVTPPDWQGFHYTRMLDHVSVATSGANCVRGVLWFQGETDANNAVTEAAYEGALLALAADLQTDLSCATPLIAGLIGPFAGQPESQTEAIRQAQRDAAAASSDILAGPETSDLPVLDGLHFNDDAVPHLLARWCQALAPLYTGQGLVCPAEPTPACSDGGDNDGDGLVDGADPGCAGPTDAWEGAPELACDNSFDDDGDGDVDLADGGCDSPSDVSETSASLPCDDGVDNDGDGFIDLADPGCNSSGDPSELSNKDCDNGVDDDGDGAIDVPGDPGCDDPLDNDETSPLLPCDDGNDNDGDSRIDFDPVTFADPMTGQGDLGCMSPAWHTESPECSDGVDNADADTLADWDGSGLGAPDPECGGLPWNDDENGFCGDGVLNAAEQCDDGDTDPGDCCDPSCQFEAGPGSPACCSNGVCQIGQTCGTICFGGLTTCQLGGVPGDQCLCLP